MSLYLSGEKLEPAKITGTKNLLETYGLMDSYNEFTKGKISSSFKSYIKHLAGYGNYRSNTSNSPTSLYALVENMPPIENEHPIDFQNVWATTTSFILQEGHYVREPGAEDDKKHKKKKHKKKKHSSDTTTANATSTTTTTTTNAPASNGDANQPTQSTTAPSETSTKKHKKKRNRTEGTEGEHKSSKKKRKKEKDKDKDKDKEKEKEKKVTPASTANNPIPITQNVLVDPSQNALR